MPEPLEATFWLLPYTLVRRLAVAATMVWLAFAPTWNCCVPKVPSSNFWPLNSVVCEIRSSSATNWAPSSTCAREIPSFALRTAWFRPRIWLVKRSEIARPAASSLALLIRKPDDRRWMAVFSDIWLVPRLRWAVSELMLVLMVAAMAKLLNVARRICLPVQAHPSGCQWGNDG